MSHSAGTFQGYKPEFKDPLTEKWRPIDFKQQNFIRGQVMDGIPYPALEAGILHQVWLLGKAQAWAIACGFAADYAAVHYTDVAIRIVPYKVQFKIDYEPDGEPVEGLIDTAAP